MANGEINEVIQVSEEQQEQYFSCEECFHSLSFSPEGLRHCMHIPPQFAPSIIPVNDSVLLNPDDIFKKKELIEQERKNGIISDYCKKCVNASKKFHNNQRFITRVRISHRTDCNASCDFCFNQFIERHFKPYKILPQLKQFKDFFEKGCEMFFGGGEPTIWDEFEDIINFAINENFTGIFIDSNGSVFSEKLAEAISLRKVQLVISTDTVDPVAFKKLKGLDFDVVINNIKKYLEYDIDKNQVMCKMIILPFVNDTEEQIAKWVDFHAALGLRQLALDIESIFFRGHRENIPQKYIYLLKYAEKLIIHKGLKCIRYGFVQQLIHDDKQ